MLSAGPRDLFAAVGNTPLIELTRLSRAIGRTVLGKAEHMNPGGSVKDRAARAILLDAEAGGRIGPGGTIVEGTAGNTGIALALLGYARGYRTILVVPTNQSADKFALFDGLGVEVRAVPAVPFTDDNNYYHVARRLAAETPGALFADQFENPANRRGHIETTGPEIWRDTAGHQTSSGGGRLDAFVAAAGTGGTFAGVSSYLKSRDASVRCVVADCMGSSLYAHVKEGTLEAAGDSFLEGIGIRRITANFRGAPADDALRVEDRDTAAMAHWLLREEGLFLGGSAALNVVAAARVARTLPAGAVVVTVLCDGGGRYLSRLFNREWLEGQGMGELPGDLDVILG